MDLERWGQNDDGDGRRGPGRDLHPLGRSAAAVSPRALNVSQGLRRSCSEVVTAGLCGLAVPLPVD